MFNHWMVAVTSVDPTLVYNAWYKEYLCIGRVVVLSKECGRLATALDITVSVYSVLVLECAEGKDCLL